VVAANARWRRLAGAKVGSVRGAAWLSAVAVEDRARVAAAWTAAIAKGGRFRLRLGGVWVEAEVSPVRDDAGTVVEHAVAFVEIDVEPARRNSEEGAVGDAFAFLGDHLSQLIAAEDRSGRADYVNRSFVDYTGLGVAELQGERVGVVFNRANRDTGVLRKILNRDENILSRASSRIAGFLGRHGEGDDSNAWYSVLASGAGIFGLGSKREKGLLWWKRDAWDISSPQDVNGGTNHFGSPFNFPEEFTTVYRLHPLVPDLIEFRDVREANKIKTKVPVAETVRGKATAQMRTGRLENWGLSMGRQRLGLLHLQNHPMFLQNLEMKHLGAPSGRLDIVALDIIRDRERGVPGFNEFRRQIGLKSLKSFDDFIDVRLPESSPERKAQQTIVKKLRKIYGTHKCDASKQITVVQKDDRGEYINDCLGRPDGSVVDNVEDVDMVVGWLAEHTRPHGFAISETQFQVFILNASRRLFSDRFFTSSFRPEFYTHFGFKWVNENGPNGVIKEKSESNGHEIEVSPLKRVLQRTIPELKSELDPVVNVFDPWARDRGDYYSLQWKPRPGAESDVSFRD